MPLFLSAEPSYCQMMIALQRKLHFDLDAIALLRIAQIFEIPGNRKIVTKELVYASNILSKK